ncbi:MAG: oxidoreductase, partial [Caldilineaceae bacterium]|nr:oxidoreductase [Caldilineaceae bacterium]
MYLRKQSVLITGAGSGIGRATALACAAQGASLTL